MIGRLKSVISRMLGIPSRRPVEFSEILREIDHYDADIGQYKYSVFEDSWYGEVVSPLSNLVVCGSGEFPHSFEKAIILELAPQVHYFAELVKSKVSLPDGYVDESLPSDLAPKRMTICSTEVVELYFEPGVDVEGDYVSLMATLTPSGELMKTEWIT